MKKRMFFSFVLSLVSALFLSNSFATHFPHTILEGHTAGVFSVAFSPDGATLASGSYDDTVRLWDVATGAHKRTLRGHTSLVFSVAFSPDGTTLASGSYDDTVRLWDVATGKITQYLSGHTAGVSSVAFSPDGTTLASGSYDDTVRLWDVATGAHKRALRRHTDSVYSVSFSPDGATLASGSYDDTVRLWDVATGAHKRTLEGHTDSVYSVYSVSFSPDGATLAGGSSNATVWLWDVASGAHKRALRGHTDSVYSVSFSPDGATLASGSKDDTVRLWDVATGAHKHTLEGHTGRVSSVAFSPDGATLASGSEYTYQWRSEGNIRLWDLSTHVSITPAVVSIAPAVVEPPAAGPNVGEQFTINISIAGGQDVQGYRVTVGYNNKTLKYISHTPGDYLPGDVFIGPTTLSPFRNEGSLFFNIVSPAGIGNGDGTLATITFEVVALKASLLTLSVTLSDGDGERLLSVVKSARVMEPSWDVNNDGYINILDLSIVASRFGQAGQHRADINGDGVVDIKDLVLVAGAFGKVGAAPSAYPYTLSTLTAADIQDWLTQVQQMALTDPDYLRGIAVLEQLLTALTPKEMALLPNYPNPFNPETWIPYHLAHAADVTLTIYDTKGAMVRRLALGHQPAGYYTARTKAAYWDGRNENGESVASGMYFYYLSAGDYSATRRMVIVK